MSGQTPKKSTPLASKDTPATVPHLLDWLRPYRRRVFIGYGLLIVTQILEKSVPYCFGRGLQALGSVERSVSPRGWILALALIAIASWFIRTQSRMQIFNAGRDVEYDIRNALLTKLHRLGSAGNLRTAEWMSRCTHDVTQVRLLAGFGALNAVNAVLGFTLAAFMMCRVNQTLALAVLVPFPFIIVVAVGFATALHRQAKTISEQTAAASANVLANLNAARLIRGLALEKKAISQFDASNSALTEAVSRATWVRASMFPLMAGLLGVANAIAVIRGAMLINAGALTLGETAAFLGYLAQLSWPTLAFGFLISIVQRGRASYARIAEVLMMPEAETPESKTVEASTDAPSVQLGNVEVRASKQARPSLGPVSLVIRSGELVAVIGPTGSGKSTLIRVLGGELAPSSGTIQTLARRVRIAHQSPFLFSLSIRSNLEFARSNPSDPSLAKADEKLHEQLDAELTDVLRDAAFATEVTALPKGIETQVGPRGIMLSGGQKQRLSMARAYASQADLLLMDDPLSALDTLTETEAIRALLRRRSSGQTIVLATHKIRAAEQCDRIIILDNGLVAFDGHPSALATEQSAAATWYRRTRELQDLLETIPERTQQSETAGAA